MPTYRTFQQHLDPSYKPKRILALDGGGIRGLLTAGLLQRIEDLLRARAGGDPAFRLSDYFDLIGGTSTGSIIRLRRRNADRVALTSAGAFLGATRLNAVRATSQSTRS